MRVPVSHAVALVAACLTVLLLAGPVATSSARELGSRPLAEGTRGADVRELQKLLRKAGFAPKVDGVYGHGTWRIQRRLERELGVRVDGIATSADVRRLRRALKPSDGTGGMTFSDERARPRAVSAQEVPGDKAQLTDDGLAIAPANAPQEVKDIIAAGNEIAKLPYRYGGGHGKWKDTAYDCSGSVSFALHGADLLEAPMASGGFETWAKRGAGRWVTVYAKADHMYMVVAGLRFDTSGRADTGSRWQRAMRPTAGYAVRHPEGL